MGISDLKDLCSQWDGSSEAFSRIVATTVKTLGMSSGEILGDYPGLDEADVRACIAYGAEMARERYVEVPLGDAH